MSFCSGTPEGLVDKGLKQWCFSFAIPTPLKVCFEQISSITIHVSQDGAATVL
jgi:hypothetical protein